MKRSNIRKTMRSFVSLLMVVVLLATTLCSNSVLTQAAQENVSNNQGNATHIDIGVSASASVTIGSTTYSNSDIEIDGDDFTSDAVTITAVQGTTTLVGSSSSADWTVSTSQGPNRESTYTINESSEVDFVYNLSDLSTSTGSSGISQVRIGGCFPVGSKSNPVVYTITLVKSVTLYAGGDTDSTDTITVNVTLSASFGYWDSDNDCPGLGGNWSSGGFSSGSGFDFLVTSADDLISITKVVVDENGNMLDTSAVDGQAFGYTVTSPTSGTGSTTDTGTITVGSSGVGFAAIEVSDMTDFTVTETSYPATIGDYSFVSSSVTYDSTNHTATITNVYSIPTTEVTVTKVWDDAANTDYRPEEITVYLLADGDYAKDDSGANITATLNSENNWTYTFTGLTAKSGETEIAYTVKEDSVDGYTSVITGDAASGYTITNTLNVGQLALTKTVNDPDDAADATTFTFLVSGFDTSVTSISDSNGNAYSVVDGVATILVPEGTTVTLVYVPVGTYTVTESGVTSDGTATVNTYTWTVDGSGTSATVTAGQTATVDITNTITGTATVVLTKVWDDLSNYWSTRPDSIEVTLTAVDDSGATYVDSDGNSYTYTIPAWSGTGDTWTYSLAGVAAYDVDGYKLTYAVTETAVDGYTTTYTYNSDGGLTPADNVNATITNTLNTGTVTVTKVVLDADGNVVSSTENDDDFRFALWADNGDGTTTAYGTATLVAGETATFEKIPYGTYSLTEYLVGNHDHSYDTTVTINGEDANVTENFLTDSNIKTHTVTVEINETTNDVAIVVTNQEEEITVDLSTLVNGTKKLTSSSGNSETLTFNFTVYQGDTLVATGVAADVSTDDAEATDIEWTLVDADAFTYSEVGTYTYVITETVSTIGGVVYDSTRYTLTIEVTKDENTGELIATASMIKNAQSSDGTTRVESNVLSESGETLVTAASTDPSFTATDSFTAAFENTYDPSATSIILRAIKTLSGRSLKTGEFTVTVTEYTDATYTTTGDEDGDGNVTITRSNGANGNMGFEVVYEKEGTYYYTVTEVDGGTTSNGVTYDDTTYYIKVTVTDVSSVLTVTEAVYSTDKNAADSDWTSLFYETTDGAGNTVTEDVYLPFTNTYKATGNTTLSVIKVLMGRDFNVGDTFTFTITALDSAAPALTDPGVSGVEFTDNGDGTYTVTVTVQASDDSEESQNPNYSDTYLLYWVLASLTADQDDVGSWVYRISEKTGTANGMTYDIATYGHLITVTVADNGDGTLDVTPSSTNDTDWNGDGTTDIRKSVIVNSFSQESTNIYGAKTWVDGGATHDNTTEVELTLYYSTDGGTTWTAWTDNGDGTYSFYYYDEKDNTGYYYGAYYVEWGTLNTNRWRILGLPVYDPAGYVYTYKVEETAIDGYVTTYSNDSMVYDSSYSDTDRFTITNTIEQEYIKLYGTKTWVDDVVDENHDNATEITLIVTRNSDSTELTTLTEVAYPGTGAADTYIVVWNGDDYAIYWYYDATDGYVGLEKYDAAGYEYVYNVAEDTITGISNSGESFTYETETEFYFDADEYSVFDFTNRQPDDDPTDPTKDVDVDSTDGLNYGDDGEKVSVGDTVTYIIKYYNNTNTEADVTITDVLDNGVTYEDSSDGGSVSNESVYTNTDGSTFRYGGTVTWTIENVAPFTEGEVTLIVTVNENARSHDTGESGADIDNQATVVVAGNSAETNLVTNPLEDDDPEDPVKGIMRVDSEDGDEKTETDSNGNIIVAVGDYVYYTIRAYNNYATGATLTITDVLDEGVEFVRASAGYSYDENSRTVTWTREVNAFSYATVTLVVKVTDDAKEAAQTYEAVDPEDPTSEYEDYTYTTSASIANQASIVNSNDVTVTTYTNVPENPLEDDPEEEPTKSISESSPSGYYDEEGVAGVTTDANGNQTGTSVGVGGLIEYDITYYNNYNSPVTVVITDTLDVGVNFKSASGTDVTGVTLTDEQKEQANFVTYELTSTTVTAYNVDTEEYEETEQVTVTWTIYNATALLEGTVTLVVEVNEYAKAVETGETVATVENDAVVVITKDTETGNSYTTNLVVNPIDPDQPGDPSKVVAANSEAGVDGAAVKVGDKITYEISYYNHNSEAANATIVDVLDEGVTYVNGSATGTNVDSTVVQENITEENYVTYNVSTVDGVTTVTWIIYNITPFTGDVVELTVQVNEKAQVVDDGDTEADVDNQATLIMVDHTADTNIVTNPVADDDPTDPTKDVAETSAAGTTGKVTDKTAETYTYDAVAVGDQITYAITYYNNLNEAATVTITDVLDDGVTYVSATYPDGTIVTDNIADQKSSTDVALYGGTVTWTFTEDAFTGGTVYLTVEVNENAKTIESDETLATVENQASVQIGTANAKYTYTVIHPITPDDPTDPVKTIVETDETTGNTVYLSEGSEVSVSDIIEYDIAYYNNNNETSTVTIVDKLDPGVDFVSASDGGVYVKDTHTVTWTLTVTPFTAGSVTLNVQVNTDAKTVDAEDGDSAKVQNDAEVTIVEIDNTATTEIVWNPVSDDDPEDPTKIVAADSEAGVEGAAVSVGEKITYEISYYNNNNSAATVVIEDELDKDVKFISASNGGTYNQTTHTVTWTLTADAYTYGYVTLTVEVLESALSIDSGDEIADVENDAVVTVGGVENTTNLVINPLNPDDPEDPVKTEISAEDGTEETVTISADGTRTYGEVTIGTILTYEISYYNHYNEETTITITDELDPGVSFVAASDGGVYNETTGIVTWTFTASALERDSVILQVEVTEEAKTVDAEDGESAAVSNEATVTVGEVKNTSNVVVNPVASDEPGDPTKVVSADSDAGVAGEGVTVDSEITYVISYYNHYSSAATVEIVDELDPGVEFVSASGVEASEATDADVEVYEVTTAADGTVTVTWTVDVTAYTEGYVTLTVRVTEDALVVDEGDEIADVENDATVTVGEVTNDTNIVINPVNPDDPQDPVKTEVIPGTGKEATVVSTAEDGTKTYEEVAVGSIIVYDITYYNYNNSEATVVITDPLDEGVDFVSASDGGVYDKAKHTVTWTLTVDAFTGGSVVLEVEVNANAKETTEDEETATVENQATVTIGDVENTYTTNLVVNPISPDDPEEPTKVIDANSEAGVEGDAASVGETITYVISYYNHDNATVIVRITDELDPGVDFVSASGVEASKATDADTVVYEVTTDEDGVVTVTWIITDVDPYEDSFVTLTVKVNENAKLIEDGEDEATVENQASVQIGNNAAVDTNKVETPLDPEDPTEPVKTISEGSASGYYDENGSPAVTVDADGTVTGSDVGVGGIIEYVITYYNHTSQTATVTITDELDPGVTFESATGVLVEDASALDTSIEAVGYDYVTYKVVTSTDESGNEVTTVIWTIYNATPFKYGSVELQVEIEEAAKTLDEGETTATVENDADVVISTDPENTYTTNLVVNEIDDETPGDPVKIVTADSEAGVDGATVAVGDEITYAISYYNHTNSAADVIITDVLDPGVAFVSASGDYVVTTEEDGTVTVTWTLSASAYSGGFVTLTVEVTEAALVLDEGDTSADVENQATVTVGDVTNETDIIINELDPDEPAEPAKYVSPDSAAGSEVVSTDEDGNITYETVGIGDRITYEIEYYNYHNDTATIEIVDELDPGVTFISASNDGEYVYDEDTHTVTWTLTVAAYTGGIVKLVVEVNDDAKLIETEETVATVENDAVVTITADTETTHTTKLVIHPVDPDDPVDPSKTVVSEAGAAGDAVAVGDEVTYEIVYYNYNNETADVVITDVLDPGATFVSTAWETIGTETVTYDVTTDEDGIVTVTWTITGVDPYTTGSVMLTVEVNENAKLIGSDETQATITNTASVQIGNDAAVDTNTVENPITPDDPVDPTKTITTDGVAEGDEVEEGDELTYEITYYNNTNEIATVVITDALDDGVDYVSSTDGGVYDADTHTVTWTLTVDPFTAGSVSVTVKVNESAVTQVENTASVQIGNEDAVDTNTVENPVAEEEETPTETEPVPTTSDTEAVVPYTIMMLLAFMAIVVLLRGRRREEQA